MRLLVLGGTRFVGRAVVEAALDRGWQVAALHRGATGSLPGVVTSLLADRTDLLALRTALGDGTWDTLAAAGAQPWTQLPCWVPESGELAGFLASDTGRARGAGLTCRPVQQTVADTWAWVQRAGVPRGRPGMEPGLPVELERRLLRHALPPVDPAPG